jgi:integrating conjugative element protein (TIGR03746 family)
MAYRNDNENLKVRVKYLWFMVGLLCVIIGGMGIGWDRARQDAVIHLPPNLEAGGLVKINQPERIHIYAFATRVLQAINSWDDGAVDYEKAIDSVRPYLTPRFYAELKYDLEQRRVNPVDGKGTAVDELTGRVRHMTALLTGDKGKIFNDDKITVHSQGEWLALLDMHIEEQVKGLLVKSVNVRYPVRVIRYDVDINANPWGLALDGYEAPGATRLASQPTPAGTALPTQLPQGPLDKP